jgi:hypothetical protein
MSKVWQASPFILLITAELLLLRGAPAAENSSSLSPAGITNPSPTAERSHPLDLSRFYDKDPSFDAPGCWQAVPRGQQTLANIPFRIAGLIQLWGEGPAGIGRKYRQSVEGIPAVGKFQTLYVLHGSSFTTSEGTPIAAVVLRYSDGSAATNLILYGIDSRDWWQPTAENHPMATNSPSQVVWRGDHPSLPDWVKCLRLFGTPIPNPKPESEVRSIDLFSTGSRVTWVVLAITTGPSGLLKVVPRSEEDEETWAEEVTLKLTALDRDTGQPIPDMRFRVIVQSGRRPRPSGIFTADEKGEVVVNLPAERIRLLAIQTVSNDYPPAEMSWRLEQGEKIPNNYVFKVSKKGP